MKGQMKLMGEENPEFGNLLELGMTERLIVFVGAGTSIEAGLPNWDELALRYVEEALGDEVPLNLSEQFVNPKHLAVIADATVGEFKRFSTLTKALYPNHKPPRPGPTAKEIAKLYRARFRAGLETYIVTTNFDPLLEMALDLYVHERMPDRVGPARSLGLLDAYPSYFDERPFDLDESLFDLLDSSSDKVHRPTVLHLHGGVDLREPSNPREIKPIILTERDYAMYEFVAQQAMLELLDGFDCMMIGLSLQDNDVLSALYTMMRGKETMVVPQPPRGSRYFVSFNELVHRKDDFDKHHKSSEELRRLELRRLRKAGVTPLNQLKSFAQIPQVLHEMGFAVELAAKEGSDLDPDVYADSENQYERRLIRWKEDFDRLYAAPAQFDEKQIAASEQCQRTLDAIRAAMGPTDIGDEAAIHVWVRSQINGLWMLPWFCNEFARRGEIPQSLKRQVRHLEYDIALRQAFEGVSSRGFRAAAEHSRWKQIMAVPIISTTTGAVHSYGRLMVGVVTLSTNLPEDSSDLSRCFADDPALLENAEDQLYQLGVDLLIHAPTEAPPTPARPRLHRVSLKKHGLKRLEEQTEAGAA